MSSAVLAAVEAAAPMPARGAASSARMEATASKSRPLSEQEVLAAGLAKPIESDNVGFQMLSKIGFRAGEEKAKPPLDLKVKSDRMGVGLDTQLKESAKRIRNQAVEDAKKRRLEEEDIRDLYVRSRGEEFEAKRVWGQIHRAKRVLANLNEAMNIVSAASNVVVDPAQIFVEDSESSSEEESVGGAEVAKNKAEEEKKKLEPLRVLQVVIDELRGPPYFWCFWCGCKYEDEADMEANCPGQFEEDHE